MSVPEPNDFEKAAAEESGTPLTAELWSFVKQNKKWWMLPILVVLLLLAVLIVLGGTAVAPFIYTLF